LKRRRGGPRVRPYFEGKPNNKRKKVKNNENKNNFNNSNNHNSRNNSRNNKGARSNRVAIKTGCNVVGKYNGR
jgi:hypothetical protein